MTLSRRILFAVFAGWVNRILMIALNLIFIRVLFRYLGLEEQGFWVLLGSSAAFLSLMDLGVSPTLTRRIALARGKSGADVHAVLTKETREEIADLVATGSRVYRMIAILVFLVSWSLGFYFLSTVKFHDVDPKQVWIAWTILCAGYAINVWGQVWQCLLNGIGLVGWNSVIDTAVNTLAVGIQIILVIKGGGILQLAVVAAGSGLLARQLNLIIARRTNPVIFGQRGKWSPALFNIMLSPSLRYWITNLGAFLILKTDQFFISYFLDTTQIPPYNAAYSIVSNIFLFSVSIASGSAVYISHLWQSNQIAQVQAITRRSARIGMTMMVCGIACIAVAGQPLIELWLGATRHGQATFVGYPVLWTFCFMLTLETHHSIMSSCSRATEDEAYAIPAVTSGVFNLILTYLLIKPFGLLGVAMGTAIAQLLTNNWYAVYRPLRRLRMSVREHILHVMLPILGIFLIATGLGWVAVQLSVSFQSNLLTVCNTTLVTVSVLGLSVWFYGLSATDRVRVHQRLGQYLGRKVAT